MLPLSLLNCAVGQPILIELKNGETYNGHISSCDNWMNIHLKEVICTSPDGNRFWRMSECFIRGNNIKYLRIPEAVIEKVKSRDEKRAAAAASGGFKKRRYNNNNSNSNNSGRNNSSNRK